MVTFKATAQQFCVRVCIIHSQCQQPPTLFAITIVKDNG